jgi:hypothetical protein
MSMMVADLCGAGQGEAHRAYAQFLPDTTPPAAGGGREGDSAKHPGEATAEIELEFVEGFLLEFVEEDFEVT